MRYLILLLPVLVPACSTSDEVVKIFNDIGRFYYGLNDHGKYFPQYLADYIDTIKMEYFSAAQFEGVLSRSREQVLCEKYLNKDIIRLTYAGAFSFDNFFTVSLIKEDTVVYLEERESYNYLIPDSVDQFMHCLEPDSVNGTYRDVAYYVTNNLELVYQYENPIDPVFRDVRRQVPFSVWKEAEALLNDGFFKMTPWEPFPGGVDGHRILVETHFANGYYAVERWVPRKNPLASLSNFLLSHSVEGRRLLGWMN
jgi:hypothetical protein